MNNFLSTLLLKGWLGKPAYESLTVWGVAVLLLGGSAVNILCGGDTMLLSADQCAVASAWLTKIGVGMALLGIRKDKQAKEA